jgi:hypothetical protein
MYADLKIQYSLKTENFLCQSLHIWLPVENRLRKAVVDDTYLFIANINKTVAYALQ